MNQLFELQISWDLNIDQVFPGDFILNWEVI
jgi:hypothetical protein